MKSTIRQWNRQRLHRRLLALTAGRIDRGVRKEYARAGIAVPAFRVMASDDLVGGTDIGLTKDTDQITVLFNGQMSRSHLSHCHYHVSAGLHWFSQTASTVREIMIDASDGDRPSLAYYKYSVTSANDTPLPDPHFFRDHGYRATDTFTRDHAVAWGDRSDQMIWRGGLNNAGLFSLDPALADNPGVMQRLRMALACRNTDVDFRFVPGKQRADDGVLASAGLTAGFVPAHDWGSMKYAIDIDGFTNAWSNFLQRLKLGCCVLKVDSPFGYYQWYYHLLSPWEHFVPIRADLTDLTEKIDWVRSNQKKAREIAAAGQAVARSLTFQSENESAVATIEEREQR